MKTKDVHYDRMRAYVIEQLAKYKLTDTEGYTLRELKIKLAAARAMDVEVKSPHASWF